MLSWTRINSGKEESCEVSEAVVKKCSNAGSRCGSIVKDYVKFHQHHHYTVYISSHPCASDYSVRVDANGGEGRELSYHGSQ